jgi:hypothetical protein
VLDEPVTPIHHHLGRIREENKIQQERMLQDIVLPNDSEDFSVMMVNADNLAYMG